MKRADFQLLGLEGTVEVALELQQKLEASRLAAAALRKEVAELKAGSGEPPGKHGAQGEKRRKRRR